MKNQKTIEREISLKGVGIHTGKKVNFKLKPALTNSGINFIRVDLKDKPAIKAHISNITEPARRLRRTSIGLRKDKDIEITLINIR